MKPEDIRFLDLHRMFIGEVPYGFLLEVVLRIFVLFVIIVLSMRFVGQRMASSLNRNDLAAIVSIAAAVGIPMQEPSRGLLPALVISIVIVGTIRIINRLIASSRWFEGLSQGRHFVLVKDGVIELNNVLKNNISRQRLFAQLRFEQIETLGQVKRLYIEVSGSYTLLKTPEPKPGLSVLPDWDTDFIDKAKISNEHSVCDNCGWLNENKKSHICPVCNREKWMPAIL